MGDTQPDTQTASFTWDFPFDAQRVPVMADAVVCTSQPLAARAGLAAMERGGNAADAALAAAITLTVVEPVMNGLGSDALALIALDGQIHGLNGSGRSPQAWTAERFSGLRSMPTSGWDAVTVPGAVGAWVELSERFGRLPFESLFQDAIRYAREGFLVTPTVARQWAGQVPRLAEQPGFAQAFMPDGRAPRAGERFQWEDIDRTLTALAESRGQALYSGPVGQALLAHAKEHGGVMSASDLAQHRSEWTADVALDYRSMRVHQMPPNAQGLSVLIALGILQHFDVASMALTSVDRVHLQIEAMKLAFREVYAHVSDASTMAMSSQDMLEPQRIRALAGQISMEHAGPQQAPEAVSGGTVYIAAVDRAGMMVSFIQSNYQGFGSGVVVPGTGVSLHNRAAGFSLRDGHPNQVAGGKRPFHTIIPALLSRQGQMLGCLGVVGANMQPQGQMQIICNLEDFSLNPQSALDAPRWRILDDGRVTLEHSFGEVFAQQLTQRGHAVALRPRGDTEFGGAQLIHRLPGGGFAGASDHRRDGAAYGY